MALPGLLLLLSATLILTGAAHGRRVRNLESNGIPTSIEEFNNEGLFPRFAEPIPNVTVSVGRDALLACVVDNLRGYKVAWVRVDTQTILSIHHNVITQNPRISLSYNDHRSWYLHIKNVHEEDRGWYMCQVNTDPMRSRQGYLQVVDLYTSSPGQLSHRRPDANTQLNTNSSVYKVPRRRTREKRGNIPTVFPHTSHDQREMESSQLQSTPPLHERDNTSFSSPHLHQEMISPVPPSIVDRDTSTDMVVRESTNVTLTCKATGYPEPYVMWRREDGEDILYNGETVNVVDGEMLHITRVSRLHMGAYLCIASNGVPPSISKRVALRVQFPPMLSISNQLEGAYVGQDVSLECHSEAYPTSINYWTTERGDMIVSGDKYEAVSMDNGYNKYMMLKIRSVKSSDFGSYKCVAKNSLGETDGVIKLDEIPAPTTVSTSTVAFVTLPTTTRKKARGRGKNWKDRTSENQVLSDFGLEEWRESDYDTDYTLPSLGPHPARQPPGPYSSASRPSSALKRDDNHWYFVWIPACAMLFHAYS